MKAFVTGANGFTASHLVKALQQQGATVVGLVRPTSNLTRLADCPIDLVYGDLCDRPLLEKAMAGVDVVFHVAAYVEIGIVNAVEMERVNVEGTRTVLAAAEAAGVPKMVYCSTVGVFGDTQGRVINETYQRQQQGFSSPYDRTKYEAQKLVDAAATRGYNVVTVLPSGIFGADDPHFGPALQNYRRGRLKVWAGGQRITGIVHVDDLADLLILAAEKGQRGEWYIASTGDLTTQEMFEILSEKTGIPVPVEIPAVLVRLAGNILEVVGRLTHWQPPISRERVHYLYDRNVRVDASKARQELGWQPRSVEETVRQLM